MLSRSRSRSGVARPAIPAGARKGSACHAPHHTRTSAPDTGVEDRSTAWPALVPRGRSGTGRILKIEPALSASQTALERANADLRAANTALRLGNEALRARIVTHAAALRQRTAQVETLARDLTRAEERERQRVAEVIHADLQQLLSLARIGLGTAREQVGPGSMQQDLDEVDGLITESLNVARSLTTALSPPLLCHGLAAGLRWLGEWYEDRFALLVRVEADEAADAEQETRVTLFQAARELLFNIVKHAHATAARVRLDRTLDGHVRVVVSDDGVGFEPEALWARTGSARGYGLFSVREHLQLIGGQLEVDSAPGRGATFTMLAPCAPSRPRGRSTAAARPRNDGTPEGRREARSDD